MRHDPHDDERIVVIEHHNAGIGSFLIGLGLGAAAALLLAPQSGRDTRRQLSRRAQNAGEEARRRAQGVVGDVTAGVTGRIDLARDAVELKRQQVQRAVEAGRVAAAQARDDLERRIAETKAAYQAGSGVAPGGYEPPDDDALEG
ncbi:MAG TPA: YtxH domain-containing protein [Gemmatirosa sp.]